MRIDAQTGQTTLPNGFSFDATLTQSEFESKQLHDPSKVRNPGTPWHYFPFNAGQIEGYPLDVTLCFYRDVLVSFTFQIDLYPPGPKSWDALSYPTEEKMQKLHAALFQRWFGRPHKTTRVGAISREFPALAKALHYKFEWGTVWCGHDERGDNTEAGVHYKKNEEWARDDYRSKS